jgi:hypothetical protein
MLAAVLGAASSASAATIKTGDAYSNGSGGTSSSVRANFDAGGCTGAVHYEIGTAPLAQGGFRTVDSAANEPSSPPGRTFDATTIRDLVEGTLYYYRAVLTTHKCEAAGQTAAGAQRCLTKKGSINELETTACPGDPAGGGGGGGTGTGGSTDKCKKPGSCPSNRIKLPGHYCRVTNGFSETFMFALKVQNVKCKVAEALVDNNHRVSGDRKRFRLRPSKAICKAVRSAGTGVEYFCRLGRQKIWYLGYGNVRLKRQTWTNLYPRGS